MPRRAPSSLRTPPLRRGRKQFPGSVAVLTFRRLCKMLHVFLPPPTLMVFRRRGWGPWSRPLITSCPSSETVPPRGGFPLASPRRRSSHPPKFLSAGATLAQASRPSTTQPPRRFFQRSTAVRGFTASRPRLVSTDPLLLPPRLRRCLPRPLDRGGGKADFADSSTCRRKWALPSRCWTLFAASSSSSSLSPVPGVLHHRLPSGSCLSSTRTWKRCRRRGP